MKNTIGQLTSYIGLRNYILTLLISAGIYYTGISQTPGITSIGTISSFGAPNLTVGVEFTTTSSITISSLGIWDEPTVNGLVEAHPVTLYTNTGTILATVTIPAGTGATIINGFRYADLSTPVTLMSGQTYVAAAYYPTTMDKLAISVPPFSGTIIAPGLNVSPNGRIILGSSGFPSDSDPISRYYGANFLTIVPPVPTLSQWGILIFGLSLLVMGLVVVYNVQISRHLVPAGDGSTESHSVLNQERFNIPFDVEKYKVALLWSGGLAVLGFAAIYLIWGKIITDDIVGFSITVPVVAYVLYLMKEKYE